MSDYTERAKKKPNADGTKRKTIQMMETLKKRTKMKKFS